MRNHPPRGSLIASAMLSSPREKSLVWWKQDANDGLAEGVIMYMHVFSCRVFTRELSYFIAKSKNVVDVTFLPQGLHEAPKVLNSELQASIARFREECDSWRRRRRPDYLALCFGLCSDSIVGIEAIDVPIVVPRVDDCVGIYLGSEERYLEYFNNPKNQKKYQYHTNLEKELLYYFQKITDKDKRELIEIAKIKNKSKSQ